MHYTNQQVKNYILLFATMVNRLDGYKALIGSEPLPKLVEMIVYDMFVFGIGSTIRLEQCTEDVIDAYRCLRAFANELREKGWVEFY